MAVGLGNITTIGTSGWWTVSGMGIMQEIGVRGWWLLVPAVPVVIELKDEPVTVVIKDETLSIAISDRIAVEINQW